MPGEGERFPTGRAEDEASMRQRRSVWPCEQDVLARPMPLRCRRLRKLGGEKEVAGPSGTRPFRAPSAYQFDSRIHEVIIIEHQLVGTVEFDALAYDGPSEGAF